MLDVACGSDLKNDYTEEWIGNHEKWEYVTSAMACLCENSKPDPNYNESLAELVTESPGSSQKCNPLYHKAVRGSWLAAEVRRLDEDEEGGGSISTVAQENFDIYCGTLIPTGILLIISLISIYCTYVSLNLRAREALFLRNMWSVEQLEEFVRKAKKAKPDVNFTITCYHIVWVSDDDYEERTTHHAEANVKIKSWRDSTALVDETFATVRALVVSLPTQLSLIVLVFLRLAPREGGESVGERRLGSRRRRSPHGRDDE